MVSSLGQYLRSCLFIWFSLYLGLCLLLGLPSLMLHVMGVGALLCACSYFKLAPPSPESGHALLGTDPRNYDGSPSKGTQQVSPITILGKFDIRFPI